MKRIRISITGLMTLVAVLAVDFALMPNFQQIPNLAPRLGIFGALLMVHILAVYLAIAVSGLARRGEVSLSRVAFLMTGGTAILLLIAFVNFAPLLFFLYMSNTAGLYVRPGQQQQIPAVFFFGEGGVRAIDALVVWGAVTPPLLVPALLAGRATRGYRLKLLKGPEAEAESGGSADSTSG